MIKGDVVKEYLRKFPNIYSRTLAKLLMAEQPGLFDNEEQARGTIRYYRAANGEHNRNNLKDYEFTNQNPYNFPASDETEYIPYVLPAECNKILCISDIHVPYHSISALNACFDWAKEKEINTVLINGDLLDSHELSYFLKDPRKKNYKEEIMQAVDFLLILKKEFPGVRIFFKDGNHEKRLETYMKSNAPALFGFEEFHLENIMHLSDLGVEHIEESRIIHAGKLNIMHGHEVLKGATNYVNPARTLFLKTKESSIIGDRHQTSEHSEPTLNGDLITCWSQGCLCELHPDYRPLNSWNHGFSRITVDEDGYFRVTNIRIKDGKVY